VRLRTKVTKGPGSHAAGISMAYKLIDAAQARWRAVNAPHLVALVRAGAVFHKGKLLERPVDITPAEPNAESTETEVAPGWHGVRRLVPSDGDGARTRRG
jgi:putative transposase